jgi:hypothetical protein
MLLLTKKNAPLSSPLIFHLHAELSHFLLMVYFSTKQEKLNLVAYERVAHHFLPNYDLYF